MDVLLFGQLAELAGGATISLDAVPDTEQLLQLLKEQYPAFQNARFTIAVNNQVTHQNTPLPEGAKIALLPPFSGG
jgi:molybdopterin converting factor small subunit